MLEAAAGFPGLQVQLEKERAAAVRQLAELQRAAEERLLAGVAAGMHAGAPLCWRCFDGGARCILTSLC